MYTTYHFQSASDIDKNIIDAIKAMFQGKPVVITVEEEYDETAFLNSDPVNKAMLQESIKQDKEGRTVSVNLSAEE